MENLHPPHLEQNIYTSETNNQFNLQLQEMHDKFVPEKIVKRPENHKTFGSIIPYEGSKNS